MAPLFLKDLAYNNWVHNLCKFGDLKDVIDIVHNHLDMLIYNRMLASVFLTFEQEVGIQFSSGNLFCMSSNNVETLASDHPKLAYNLSTHKKALSFKTFALAYSESLHAFLIKFPFLFFAFLAFGFVSIGSAFQFNKTI